MQEINGHIFYDEDDLRMCLYKLQFLSDWGRRNMMNAIGRMGVGMDEEPLCNIVNDPVEYNIDYLYSLDSEVTEEFIELMKDMGYLKRQLCAYSTSCTTFLIYLLALTPQTNQFSSVLINT